MRKDDFKRNCKAKRNNVLMKFYQLLNYYMKREIKKIKKRRDTLRRIKLETKILHLFKFKKNEPKIDESILE